MLKILVTGGNGFIGSHLIDALSTKGHYVRNFAGISEPKYNFSSNVETISGDILDLSKLERSLQGADGVIHLAAVSRIKDGRINPLNCMEVNIMGAVNVLEGIRKNNGNPWLILGGSVESQWDQYSPDIGTFKIPTTIYGLSKFTNELSARQYAMDYGMKIMVLRFYVTYGSTRDNFDKVLPTLILKSLYNENLDIATGKSFGFIHYKDIIKGFISGIDYLSKLGPPGGYFDVFDLAPEKNTSLDELAQIIIREGKSKSRVIFKKEMDIKTNPFPMNQNKAKEVLGFSAEIGLQEGIHELIEALKKLEDDKKHSLKII